MAKRQNFVVGSTNPNTNTWTSSQLNNGWDKYQVLKSGDLDGVFNAVSDYSNDSSNEIANAIQALTGEQPTGASQSELASALQKMREEIETSSLTFKGYVATSAPSASTYGLVEGNIWINASAMPTTFPVPASSIRVWNGASWATTTNTYTVKDFDFFRNINNSEGYYWFGGQWVVMSTDMSTTYFSLNQTSGKWEIKSSVNLPGSPTTTTPAAGNSSTRIATTKFVADSFAPLASPALTGTPTAPTPAGADDSTKIATTAFVKNVLEGYVPTGGAANTSLSNLVDAGKNIANWSSNVSNCITEIPQDIKLELNNGTLTLKAGSKVYVPNGVGVFDVVTIASDLSVTPTWLGNKPGVIYYRRANNNITATGIDYCYSGSTAPTYLDGGYWYDIANNKIKLGVSSSWVDTDECSLPIAIVNDSSNVVTSIDQVFNGFGYIGSTVFALPGVKGLIPNGRNADGSLKNIEVTLDSVKTNTTNGTDINLEILLRLANGTLELRTTMLGTVYYNANNNHVIQNGIITTEIMCGNVLFDSGGKITSFTPKTAFHAVDYSDFENAIATVDSNIKTNTILAKRNVDNSYMEWFGGTNYNKGAFFRANGKDFAESPGSFICCANDGVTFRELRGYVDGTLTWDNQRVLISGSPYGYPNYSAVVRISSGWTATSNGVVFGGATYGDDMIAKIVVNGHIVFFVSTSHSGNSYGNAVVSKGDVITVQGGTYYFAPMK